MSEKSEKTVQKDAKKRPSKALLLTSVALSIAILEALAIGGAVLITESRNKGQTLQLDQLTSLISRQQEEIRNLQLLPNAIRNNAQKIAENAGNLQLYAENFNNLKNEVGNRKVDILYQQLAQVSQRTEALEEAKSVESLILSAALLIKENALYQRDFSQEADVLVQLSDGQEDILSSVQTIQALKKQYIASDEQLIEQFNTIAKNFSFANTSPNNAGKEESAISKSISLIKDTVSGLNFDKIVVVKKQNRTAAQEQLIAQLATLVNQHNFTGALDFIRSHQDFSLLETQDLSKWQADVERRISFDSAISQIISAELSSIRQSLINSQTPAEP